MPEPRWLEIARGELGVHEIPGPASEGRIVEYHSATTLHAKDDSVPWCAAFCCWVMERAGIQSTKSAAAASWRSWGVPCDPPRVGCIVVIRQKLSGANNATGSTSGFHVGFWLSLDAAHVEILGGNQHDSVKVSRFPLAGYEVVAYRWPADQA